MDVVIKVTGELANTAAMAGLPLLLPQVCDVLRSLERTCVKLKAYIDQLLAVVLESNPILLEGMPRIQQNVGMKLELFKMASLQEVS